MSVEAAAIAARLADWTVASDGMKERGLAPRDPGGMLGVLTSGDEGWYWAVDVLTDDGAEDHLVHPLGVKGFAYRRVKSDVRDASDLADLLRMGRPPEGWIAPAAMRDCASRSGIGRNWWPGAAR
jgi:hypothetical protein